VESLAFSLDGQRIIAIIDGAIRSWPGTAQEIFRLINKDHIRGVIRGLTEAEKQQYSLVEHP
jgi:hypothetical protein